MDVFPKPILKRPGGKKVAGVDFPPLSVATQCLAFSSSALKCLTGRFSWEIPLRILSLGLFNFPLGYRLKAGVSSQTRASEVSHCSLENSGL